MSVGTVRCVRWEQLFADLEGQLDEAERLERDAEVADRTQREQALVRVGDRVRAAIGRPIEMRVVGAGVLAGKVTAVGPDWLTLTGVPASHPGSTDGSPGLTETLVPTTAVLTMRGIPERGVAAESPVTARLGLGYAIRVLMRERSEVVVVLLDGQRLDGVISQVGADYFEVATSRSRSSGEGRRRDRTCVSFTGLAALSRR